MKYTTPVGIWLFLIVTVLGEVFLSYSGPGKLTMDIGIGVIAMVDSLVAALFFMNIRKEPSVVQYMMLAPLALVMILILTLLFAIAG